MSSLKYQITTSTALLPISMAVMVGAWLLQAPLTAMTAAGLGFALFVTLVLRWVSNAVQLIRVRSWAVSSVFALMIAATGRCHEWSPQAMGLCALYMTFAGGLLLSTWASRPQLSIFVGSIGLAGMVMMVPQTVWLLPMGVLAMMLALRVWTGRTLAALLLGLLLPLEVWAAWSYLHGTLGDFAFSQFYHFTIPQLGINGQWSVANGQWSMVNGQWLTVIGYCLLVVVTLVSIIHFMRTSLDDKISTRMRYITLLLQWPVLLALSLLCPDTDSLVPALALCSAPLVARWAVFSRGWMAAVTFWLTVAAMTAMIVDN